MLWLETAMDSAFAMGLTATQSDSCVLVMAREGAMLIYVDDFVLISPSLALIEEFKSYLATYFEFKDPRPLTGREFFGIHVD